MPANLKPRYSNSTFSDDAKVPFERALSTWEAVLDSTVDIEVEAFWDIFLGHLDAICIPNPIENFPAARTKDTWYPVALADKLGGKPLKPKEPAMSIFFNVNSPWYLGSGSPPYDKLDLESVALHEIGHGLGFVGAFWTDGGWPYVGSYGNNSLVKAVEETIGLTGQQLGFQLPSLNLHPTVYGLHIQDLSGDQLTNIARYPVNTPALGPPLVSNNLFFDLSRYKVYAPNPFLPFTSIDHLDDPTSLMRPSIAPGEKVRTVDAPVLEILQALGW